MLCQPHLISLPHSEILLYFPVANEALVAVWVGQGNRPTLDAIPADAPKELIDIITSCWVAEPAERLGFRGKLNEYYYAHSLSPLDYVHN